MRILAIDWGTVRVGAAVSDPDGKIAFPLDHFIESKTAVDEIKKLINELGIEKILIGVPKAMSGAGTASTEAVEKFVIALKDQIACQIEYADERLSSIGASKTLTQAGLNQKEQRGLVDNIAAQQMLQTYLDKKN